MGDCDICEGYGVVATERNDMDGWPIEAPCPKCNSPIPENIGK